VEYKEILTPEQFTVFACLRDLRKKVAARDAVPIYNVLRNNNAQNCRSANRNRNTPDNRNNNLGFGPAPAPPARFGATASGGTRWMEPARIPPRRE